MRDQLLYYVVKYHGEYHRIKKAIEKNEDWEKINYEGKYVTILDEDYPKELFELDEPPFLLFYEGHLNLLKKKKICVIGSRMPSLHARKSVDALIRCENSEVLVSGLAKGIDAIAHEEAIRMNKKTIGVIGCGLDITYPKENKELYERMRKDHLILTEYPKGVRPLAHHFPSRNRLLAALGERCYVVEAKQKSGTMITANFALDLGKEIIAFPYRYDDAFGKGCNELIQQGASIFMGHE